MRSPTADTVSNTWCILNLDLFFVWLRGWEDSGFRRHVPGAVQALKAEACGMASCLDGSDLKLSSPLSEQKPFNGLTTAGLHGTCYYEHAFNVRLGCRV
jgi:hypothetical protein